MEEGHHIQRFRALAHDISKRPTPDGHRTLNNLCEALNPEEARSLLSDVFRAYDGDRDVQWLSEPNALQTLFDVGDLADRLAESATLGVEERRTLRQKAVDNLRSTQSIHHEHRVHVERLDLQRRSILEVNYRNAATFDLMQASGFCGASGKTHFVLTGEDDLLARQPPPWWSDLRIDDVDPMLQQALVYRLRSLVRRRGHAALPTSVHRTLDDVQRRAAASNLVECPNDVSKDVRNCKEDVRRRPTHRWSMRRAIYALSWIFPWSFWR